MAESSSTIDRDRLMRIETLVESMSAAIAHSSDALERHILDEENDFRSIRTHMTEATRVAHEVETMKKDVRDLQNMKNRALGWIAAVIFTGGVIWELVIHPIKMKGD